MSSEVGCSVLLAAESVELRRLLGPTAWAVFEELLLASTSTPDGRQASMSVRSLAARLGLGKDTVARAFGRLRRAGLVTPVQSRTSTGVFATGSYLLTIPDSITIRVPSRPTRPSNRPHVRPTACQLALGLDP